MKQFILFLTTCFLLLSCNLNSETISFDVSKVSGSITYESVINYKTDEVFTVFSSKQKKIFEIKDPVMIQKINDYLFYLSNLTSTDKSGIENVKRHIWKIDFKTGKATEVFLGSAKFCVDAKQNYLCYEDAEYYLKNYSNGQRNTVRMAVYDLKSKKTVKLFESNKYVQLITNRRDIPYISYLPEKNSFSFQLATNDWHIAECLIQLDNLEFSEVSVSNDTIFQE